MEKKIEKISKEKEEAIISQSFEEAAKLDVFMSSIQEAKIENGKVADVLSLYSLFHLCRF